MHTKPFLLSTIGYLICTFAFAILWHLVLFAEIYEDIGYIARKEPIFAFGFLAILLQGMCIAYLYPKFENGNMLIASIGVYHWSMHVLSAAAKNPIAELPTFFVIETLYLALQFSIAALLLKWIYKKCTM